MRANSRIFRLVAVGLLVVVTGCAGGSGATPPSETDASGTLQPTTDPSATSSPANPCDVGWDFGNLPVGETCWADPDNKPSTPLRVLYTIPADGWLAWPTRFPDGRQPNTADPHVGISMVDITNLTIDACTNQRQADPPVGPTVDDLAAALANLPPFEVTSTPAEVAIYGYTGKFLELTVPDLPWRVRGGDGYFAGCNDGVLRSWIEPHLSYAFYGYLPGTVERFWILDVDGTRLVIEANWSPGVPPEWITEMQAILDSIQIEPKRT